MSKSTAAERRHMARVAQSCCILCRHLKLSDSTPAVVHHLRTGQGRMRASHYDTMALCPYHHQFSGFGVHDMGRDEFAALYAISEVELLHKQKQLLGISKTQDFL